MKNEYKRCHDLVANSLSILVTRKSKKQKKWLHPITVQERKFFYLSKQIIETRDTRRGTKGAYRKKQL